MMAKALSIVAFLTSRAVLARTCSGGVGTCVGHDNVLLQHAHSRSSQSAKQQLSRLTCDACVVAFEAQGGCEALRNQDYAQLEGLLHLPELSGCEELECEEHLHGHCFPPGIPEDGTMPPEDHHRCDACSSDFEAAGGCEALQNNDVARLDQLTRSPEHKACGSPGCVHAVFGHCFPELSGGSCSECVRMFDEVGGCAVMNDLSGHELAEYIPTNCFPCGEEAMMHCMRRGMGPDEGPREPEEGEAVDCDACQEAFEEAGGCSFVLNPPLNNASVPMPLQCAGGVAVKCREKVARHCLSAAAGDCRTVQEGDKCFMHVRWAMRTGIVAHPEKYLGLDMESSFEQFQAFLHKASPHGCPMPCPALPVTDCHTTVPGETCHRHVTWAMQTGIRSIPAWYPTLAQDSTFESFQAWLHHMHHGDCPKPCDIEGESE